MSESAPNQTTFDLKEPPRFVSVTGKERAMTAVDTLGRIWQVRQNDNWRLWNWKTKRYGIVWELCETWTSTNGGEIERYED